MRIYQSSIPIETNFKDGTMYGVVSSERSYQALHLLFEIVQKNNPDFPFSLIKISDFHSTVFFKVMDDYPKKYLTSELYTLFYLCNRDNQISYSKLILAMTQQFSIQTYWKLHLLPIFEQVMDLPVLNLVEQFDCSDESQSLKRHLTMRFPLFFIRLQVGQLQKKCQKLLYASDYELLRKEISFFKAQFQAFNKGARKQRLKKVQHLVYELSAFADNILPSSYTYKKN